MAARPNVGKSAFGLCVAANLAVRHGVPVAVFALEMSKAEVTQRLMCSEAKVESQRLRSGRLAPEELAAPHRRLRQAGEGARLRRRHRLRDDDGDPLESAAAEVEAAGSRPDRRRLPPAHDVGHDRENRVQEVSPDLAEPQAAGTGSGHSDSRHVPALTRRRVRATTNVPILSDLRESGSIERDADLVAFLYRDDYYNDESDQQGLAEVILAKHNGPTDTVKLSFLKRYAKFADLATL